MRRFFLALPFVVLLAGALHVTLFFHQPLKRLFISADKEGEQLQKEGKYQEALKTYEDPLLIGNLYYKKGEFKKALASYEQISTKEALYNRANTLVMLGKYEEAVQNYQLVLQADPTFVQAKENLAIALARQAELDRYKDMSQKGNTIGADKVVYGGKNFQKNNTEETTIQQETIGATQAWLDRLQTSPSKFLALKFRYQYEEQKRPKQ